MTDGLCLYVFRLYWGEDCVCWRQCGWEPHDSHGPQVCPGGPSRAGWDCDGVRVRHGQSHPLTLQDSDSHGSSATHGHPGKMLGR